MAGVLKAKQLRGEVELPGLLKVSGKLDFIAGGEIDWERAKAEITQMQKLFAVSVDDMPPFIFHAIRHIVAGMERQYANKPLKEVVFEAKSVSSFMMEKLQKTKKAMGHHVMQCGHYVIANKLEAKLVYISKDSAECEEYTIENSRALMKAYRDDVATMTEYFNGTNHRNPLKSRPPLEPEIEFDEDLYRFHLNFKCEYSNYLTLLYGYKNPEEYRNKWNSKVASWNRVFRRCARGEKMTDMNKSVLKEVVPIFPEWDRLVLKARSEGAFLKPEELEEE